jgi:hypothetical protein
LWLRRQKQQIKLALIGGVVQGIGLFKSRKRVKYVTSLIESSFLAPIPEPLHQTTGRRLLRDEVLSSEQKDGQSDISPDQYAQSSEREQQRHRLRQFFYDMYCQHRFPQEKGKILIISDDGI